MKKIVIAFLALSLAALSLDAQPKKAKQQPKTQGYDVAAYLYPAYAAGDPRLRPFWPMGMGEWETVLTMQKRYPGHDWDRHPLWGYINEADPAVMEMEIDEATQHGVNVFIFDWYWFDGRPWMETTLTEGFLKARNRDKMQFYLMWANHNVDNSWDTRIAPMWESNIIYRGGVDREEFEKICKRNIELFFKQPNYYKIDGKPVFMIYEVTTFIEGIGGVDAAVDALKWFRNEVKKAGFPDLELQFTMWDSQFNYSGVDDAKVKAGRPRDEFARKLGFNSMSHYQFCHFIDMNNDYEVILNRAYQEWDQLDEEFTIPYYPHVSIGWDNSPRYRESAVVKENTPERFEGALRKAKAWVDARPKLHKLITINSWNEWTETSYLQPDDVYGYGYLDAVKHVFVDEAPLPSPQEIDVKLAEGRESVPAGEFGYNPISPMGVYMADPSAKVLDGKLYVACSLDESPDYWCSGYHHMLSSEDALHWTLHTNVFATKGPFDEVSYSTADLYAPDIAERNGKYYLYYDLSEWTEGVAVSDSPTGPFKDGVRIGDITGIDPCVFIDDDGQAYYFWDQFSAQGAKLNDDMVTLDMSTLHQGIVTEDEHFFHEGSFVFKRDGWYYYVYADVSRQNMPSCIGYSMSRNVFGPYEYKGVIVDSAGCDPDVWNNHGSVVEFNGQWYVLYHRSTHHSSKLRKACIEPITFNEDGTINEVEMTSQGAGKPIPATSTIDAARACLFNGGPHVRLMAGRSDREVVAGVLDGSKAAWKYVDFPAGLKKFTIRVRALVGGRIDVHQDQSFYGAIASVDVPAGKGEWLTLECDVDDVKEGPQALWFTFSGDWGSWRSPIELFEIDWFRFE